LLTDVDCDGCRYAEGGFHLMETKSCTACRPQYWLCDYCKGPLRCPECCERCDSCGDAACSDCIESLAGYFPTAGCCGEYECAVQLEICPACYEYTDDCVCGP
jgi:hypothetical protein